MHDISKHLKTIRTSKGWTQQQMADALFVTRQAISNWETGKNMPDLQMLESISDKLGVTVEEILYGKKTTVTDVKKDYSKVKKQLVTAIIMYVISVRMMLCTFMYDLNADVFLSGCCLYIGGARPIMSFTLGNFIFQYLKYNEKIKKPLSFGKIIRYSIITLCCFQFIWTAVFVSEPFIYYCFNGASIIPDKISWLFQFWFETLLKGFAFLGIVIFFIVGFLFEWSDLKE